MSIVGLLRPGSSSPQEWAPLREEFLEHGALLLEHAADRYSARAARHAAEQWPLGSARLNADSPGLLQIQATTAPWRLRGADWLHTLAPGSASYCHPAGVRQHKWIRALALKLDQTSKSILWPWLCIRWCWCLSNRSMLALAANRNELRV